jgi:hypothetical protein
LECVDVDGVFLEGGSVDVVCQSLRCLDETT